LYKTVLEEVLRKLPGDGYGGNAASVCACLKVCCKGSKCVAELYLQDRRASQESRVSPPSSRVLRKEATLNSVSGRSGGWALIGVCPAEQWALEWLCRAVQDCRSSLRQLVLFLSPARV